jgi:hypothetical protein
MLQTANQTHGIPPVKIVRRSLEPSPWAQQSAERRGLNFSGCQAMRFWYESLGAKAFGPYGFYDAFDLSEGWFSDQYLAIDKGPEVVMIENYRSGLLWRLFHATPEAQVSFISRGLRWASDQHLRQTVARRRNHRCLHGAPQLDRSTCLNHLWQAGLARAGIGPPSLPTSFHLAVPNVAEEGVVDLVHHPDHGSYLVDAWASGAGAVRLVVTDVVGNLVDTKSPGIVLSQEVVAEAAGPVRFVVSPELVVPGRAYSAVLFRPAEGEGPLDGKALRFN